MNEEDLKNKVVLPYLASLGLDLSELSFEKTFNLQLGRNIYKKIGDKESLSILGRSDILCHRNHKNIFIIEVKSDEVDITQDDIDQGISYARLLDNIAPFVLVTNGKKTILVDSISKEDLTGKELGKQSNFWQKGCRLSSDEDIEIRYEAMISFIGYSPENVKAFSESQVAQRISTLIGHRKDLSKKFIPELFVPRISLYTEFENFLKSSYKAFSIIGESGVGKTNCICDLALEYSNKSLVLFFNATLLNKSLLKTICSDFNWAFSTYTEDTHIFKKLEGIAKVLRTKLIIFIDAIDESMIENFKLELSDFCLNLNHMENIKICLTCKIQQWESFLYERGTQTHLYGSIYPVNQTQSEKTSDDVSQLPGFMLKRFDDKELSDVIKKYTTVYNLRGEISSDLKKELRLGFMIKIVAETYQGGNFPTEAKDCNLLRNYLYSMLEKSKKPDTLISILREIGTTLIEEETASKKTYGSIEETCFKKRINMNISDELPEDLFSYNILVKKKDENGNVFIGFYYTMLRDYIICALSFKLDTLSPEKFRCILPTFFKGQIGLSVINYYNSVANHKHLEILEEYKETRILSFLEQYNDYLTNQFPNIREKFDPKTLKEIGILIPNNPPFVLNEYAFYPMCEEKSKPIKVLERSKFWTDEPFLSYKATVLHMGKSFKTIAPKEQAKEAIIPQIKKIIEKGLLNETKSIELMIEKVVNILYFYHRQLGYEYNINISYLPRYDKIFPIDLNELQSRVYLFLAREYYKDEEINNLIKAGTIKEKNNVYSWDDSLIDYTKINKLAEEALKIKKPITASNIQGNYPPFKYLDEIINNLKSVGIEKIEKPLFPTPDIPVEEVFKEVFKRRGNIGWIPDTILAEYSRDRIVEYVKTFFEVLIKTYNNIVETCFPLQKNNFELYNAQPISMYINIQTISSQGFSLIYGYKRNDAKENEFQVDYEQINYSSLEDKKFIHYCAQDLSLLFHKSYNELVFVHGYNTGKMNEFCVLRSWVYELLKGEIKNISLP
ncbi:MAG: type I restriction enzyme HsdR N-terminal domain-containing protein [bacterium]